MGIGHGAMTKRNPKGAWISSHGVELFCKPPDVLIKLEVKLKLT